MISSDFAFPMTTSGSPVRSGGLDEMDELDERLRSDVSFLMGAFTRLNEGQAMSNATVSSLEGKMSTIEAAMTNLASSVQGMMKSIGKIPISEPVHPMEYSHSGSQVHSSYLEPNRRSQGGYRGDNLNLDNRDSIDILHICIVLSIHP